MRYSKRGGGVDSVYTCCILLINPACTHPVHYLGRPQAQFRSLSAVCGEGPDTEPGIEKWLEVNREFADKWPNIATKKAAPGDADNFRDEKDKYKKYFSAEPGEGSILATEMGTDGSLTHLLNIPGGGTACPITEENANDHLQTLTMMGKEVFKHAVNRMKEAAEKVISRAGLQPEDIACVIPHQANLRIIDAIADRLAVPNERVFVNLDKYGNTSAAAVAIALDEANRTGAFKRGEHIVMVAFGAGLTWAAAAIRW